MDKGFGGIIDDIRNFVKDLWLFGIKVIFVVFGWDVDLDEIKVIFLEEKNLIDVLNINSFDVVVEKIM